MQVRYSAVALKQLLKIDAVWRKRIERKVTDYAADPAVHSGSVKALKGDTRMRLRVDDYWVLMTADGTVLLVSAVGHRRDVYRGV